MCEGGGGVDPPWRVVPPNVTLGLALPAAEDAGIVRLCSAAAAAANLSYGPCGGECSLTVTFGVLGV